MKSPKRHKSHQKKQCTIASAITSIISILLRLQIVFTARNCLAHENMLGLVTNWGVIFYYSDQRVFRVNIKREVCSLLNVHPLPKCLSNVTTTCKRNEREELGVSIEFMQAIVVCQARDVWKLFLEKNDFQSALKYSWRRSGRSCHVAHTHTHTHLMPRCFRLNPSCY